jgi:uncharacterized protein (DUF433 family)
VGVPRRRLHLGVPEQLADHRQALAGRDRGRGEGVTEVVDAGVLEAGAGAEPLPERLQVIDVERPSVADGKEDVVNPLLERITIDPEVCGGKPCIKGTRIWVSLILDFLADGVPEAELLANYPQLTREDVLAAIAYGAEAARERVVSVPVGRVA